MKQRNYRRNNPDQSCSRDELICYANALLDKIMLENKSLQENYLQYLSYLMDFSWRFQLSPMMSYQHKHLILTRIREISLRLGIEHIDEVLNARKGMSKTSHDKNTILKFAAFSFGELMTRSVVSLSTKTLWGIKIKLEKVSQLPDLEKPTLEAIHQRILKLEKIHHNYSVHASQSNPLLRIGQN